MRSLDGKPEGCVRSFLDRRAEEVAATAHGDSEGSDVHGGEAGVGVPERAVARVAARVVVVLGVIVVGEADVPPPRSS
jgi:hypothetical protein